MVRNHIKLMLLLFYLGLVHVGAARAASCADQSTFLVGAGIADITGPAAEIGMMGYGMMQQRTAGISQRLWARAFVIESPCNGKRVVFVNTDLGQIFQAVKEHVIKRLKTKLGKKYTRDNVMLTANHTHSGPGGYSTYTWYNITTLGFNRDNFDVIVNGIVNAIMLADGNLTPATIKINHGQLNGISYNRSKDAYLRNPQQERDQYRYDVDTEMTLLRFDTLDGKPIGMINWFPLHGVSLDKHNFLISGDNKGFAAYLFEQDYHATYAAGSFVAAFAQSNAGDVSPNPYGQSGKSGKAGLLLLEQTGKIQYEKAKELYLSATELIKGDVDFRHEHVDFQNIAIDKKFTDGAIHTTCPAAMGISMLAGTQDGEGVGQQGVTCENVINVFSKLVCEMVTTSCQGEKPIFITTGKQRPYSWTPSILPLQMIKIGNFYMMGTPFEITTMTGRRLKETVSGQLQDSHVVVSSLANAYAGYVVTNEEYGLQRYEAASTVFGPWQQAALSQEFNKLTRALLLQQTIPSGPKPLDLLDVQTSLQTDVWLDDKPPSVDFGSVHQDVKPSYAPGDTVTVRFWGGHPNNNLRTGGSFLEVQQLINNRFVPIRYDRDFDTEYHWSRNGISYSLITIVWRIPRIIEKGKYRIVHYGDWKSGWTNKIEPYVGYSSTFEIR